MRIILNFIPTENTFFVTVQSQAKYLKMATHACMNVDIFIIFYLADTPHQGNT